MLTEDYLVLLTFSFSICRCWYRYIEYDRCEKRELRISKCKNVAKLFAVMDVIYLQVSSCLSWGWIISCSVVVQLRYWLLTCSQLILTKQNNLYFSAFWKKNNEGNKLMQDGNVFQKTFIKELELSKWRILAGQATLIWITSLQCCPGLFMRTGLKTVSADLFCNNGSKAKVLFKMCVYKWQLL